MAEDKYRYKGWLNSDNFLKRCLAVVGYGTVGSLIIYGILFGIMMIFGIFFAIIGAIIAI